MLTAVQVTNPDFKCQGVFCDALVDLLSKYQAIFHAYIRKRHGESQMHCFTDLKNILLTIIAIL